MAFPGFHDRGGKAERGRRFAGPLAALALVAQVGAALPRHLTWDVSADSANQAGSGIWNTDAFWSTDGKDRNLWPGTGFVAVFAASGTNLGIQVNGTVAVDSILFNCSGYNLAGGTIQMTGAKPVIATEADGSIQSAISGTWTKAGSRKLTLSGNNIATTSFTHAAGTTFANGNSVFGAAPVAIDGPGRLILASGVEIPNSATVTSCSPGSGTGGGVFSPDSGASATWSGAIDVNADCADGGIFSGSNVSVSAFTIAGPLRTGGSATRVRQRDGIVVYRGGGTAKAFELSKGTARLDARDGLPPTAAWSQNATTDTSTLDMNGFDQTFLSLHSPTNPAAKIVNTKDWNATLRLTGSIDSSYGGTISGNIALEKTGTGRQFLTGTNTYAGPTSVRSGTLCVTGSISDISAIRVDSGAILCGSGTLAGSITTGGGAVHPGLPSNVGTLTVGNLDLSGPKISTVRIQLSGTGKPGIEYDRMAVSGNLVLGGGSRLVLDLQGLVQPGTANGILTAASISGTFTEVVVDNLPANFAVKLEYKSALVNAVVTRVSNVPPSFAKGTSQTSLEDAGPRSVVDWATSISAGSGQTPGFRVSTDRPKMFSAGPSISATGTLGWTSAPDSNGTAMVKIRMGSSGNPDSSAIDSFTIQVAAVNDPPKFAAGADQAVGIGTGVRTIAKWASSISAGPANESGQKMAFRVASKKPSLYEERPSLSADGTLRFTPSATTIGTDTLFVRLGDDGGATNGGLDSSAVDTFVITVRPLLVFRIQPDTLRLRTGTTGRFSVIAKSANGADSSVSAGSLAWSWGTSLGKMDTGRVTANLKGTSRLTATGFGMSDTGWLVVADLDSSLSASTISVTLDAGHGVVATVPSHTGTVRVAVAVVDSPLVGVGIAGSDSAILIRSNAPDSILVEAPGSLVAAKLRASLGSLSVFRRDSSGAVHLVPSSGGPDSTTVFRAAGTQAYWLGYDTIAPSVAANLGSDSISTKPVKVDWSLRDNVAETGIWLCLQEAGRRVPRCSLLIRSDSARGSASIAKSSLPLGGMVWMEGRDTRDTARSVRRDIVVKLDTIRSPWNRTEDRYEMLALPYAKGRGSAHQAFSALWGKEDDNKWRAFGATGGSFLEILSGEPLDAQGRGFWVRTRGAELSTWSFGHWTTPMSNPVAIRLEPGWNAIGNPYGFDVPWSEAFALSGIDSSELVGPYAFDAEDQGWTIPDTASVWHAWKGVALFLSGKTAVDLLVPSIAADASGRRILSPMATQREAATARGIRLSVATSQPSDTAPKVWIGQDAAGRSYPMPPMPTLGIRAALFEAGRGDRPFLSVARGPDDTNTTWNLRVSGLTPGVPMVLDLVRQDADTARKIWIHDDKSKRWLPAAGRLEIALGPETERTFALRIGPAPGKAPLPRVFGFEDRGQFVAWSLPDEMGQVQVRIDAYDLRGCLLESVVDERLDPGTYARVLRVRSPINQYLLVLRAGGQQRTLLRFWRR